MKLPNCVAAAPIRFAVLGAVLTLSGTAMAQSSVSLYGTVDAGIGRIGYGAPNGNDANKKTQFTSGSLVNNSTSHIGVRGVEDLGGGLKAGFNIETNLDLDNGNNLGSGGGFWGRYARMYLEGSWGTFQLGRTYTPSFLAMISWQLTRAANYSVVGWTYNWGGDGIRSSSVIGYKTPTLGGFTGELAYVMKQDNVVGDQKRAKLDATLKYAGGPVVAALSVNKTQQAKTNYALGGKYNLGNFALAASYNHSVQIEARRRGVSLGGQANMGAVTVTLDFARDLKNGWGAKKYTNALLEGRYALSKRTFAYLAALRLDGTNNYGLGVRHNF